jgi:hypothetical protein
VVPTTVKLLQSMNWELASEEKRLGWREKGCGEVGKEMGSGGKCEGIELANTIRPITICPPSKDCKEPLVKLSSNWLHHEAVLHSLIHKSNTIMRIYTIFCLCGIFTEL